MAEIETDDNSYFIFITISTLKFNDFVKFANVFNFHPPHTKSK